MAGCEATDEFAAKISAPRAARRFVVSTLRRWHASHDLSDHAALVSSEMAANAVIHARSPFSVTLRADRALVRVEVRDARPADVGAQHRLVARPGRGLGIVAALSQRWGIDAASGGKVVWAEFADPDEAGRPVRHHVMGS
jgi:anti-sigma regulatory factor (Ser/Thr protein kinase)